MASSKSLFLLFSVLVLLISSEAEAAGQESMADVVVDAKYGKTGGGDQVCPIARCRYGCCRRCRYSPGCLRCCSSAHETPDAELEDDVKNKK